MKEQDWLDHELVYNSLLHLLLRSPRNDLTKFIMYDEPGLKHILENSFGLLCRSNLRLRLNQFIFELHDPLFSLVSLRQPFELLQLDLFIRVVQDGQPPQPPILRLQCLDARHQCQCLVTRRRDPESRCAGLEKGNLRAHMPLIRILEITRGQIERTLIEFPRM